MVDTSFVPIAGDFSDVVSKTFESDCQSQIEESRVQRVGFVRQRVTDLHDVRGAVEKTDCAHDVLLECFTTG